LGYLDGLNSTRFKTARDGRQLFFPWGYLGHGYVMAAQSDGARLRRQLNIYHRASLVLIVAVVSAGNYVVAAIIAAVVLIFYAIWSRHQAAGLQPAEETMSFREASMSQARAYGPRYLWAMEIGALLFVVAGIFIYATDPTGGPIALLAVAFFGFCAVVFAYLLIIRGRTSAAP
jgi:hypothetical protein